MSKYNAAVRAVPMPLRIAALAVSPKGFPVPWFVWWDADGVPDFRVIGPGKVEIAMRNDVCWTCGQPLGRYKSFVIGPMCTINRISSEPPSHRDCAQFSARACPFLANPRMVRRENDLPETVDLPGIHDPRNPGAVALWTTLSFRRVPTDGGRGWLIEIGDPESVEWFAHGRAAVRDEVMMSIDTGYAKLEQMTAIEGAESLRDLTRAKAHAMQHVPAP